MREVFSDPNVRDTAYALDSVVQEVVWVTGPLIVALVVDSPRRRSRSCWSPPFASSGRCCSSARRSRAGSGTRSAHEPRVSVLANHELRAMLIPVALTGVGLGAIEVGLPSLALHAGSRPASGLLLAVWSLGSMAGGLWYGARAWSSSLSTSLPAAAGGGDRLHGAADHRAHGARRDHRGLLAGLMIAPVFSCQYALVGRAVPSGAETEAFTWVSAALVGGLAIGSAIGGGLIGVGRRQRAVRVLVLATAVAATIALRTPEPAFALQSSAS